MFVSKFQTWYRKIFWMCTILPWKSSLSAYQQQSFFYKRSCDWLKGVRFHAVKRFGYSRRYSKKPRLLWSVLLFLDVRLTLGPPTESALCCGQWRKSSRLCEPSLPTLLAGDPGHPRGESGWGSGCLKAVVRDDRSWNGCNQCRYFTLKSICEIPRFFFKDFRSDSYRH